MLIMVAILHEDDKPIRAWKDDACIFKAYSWAHREYCLDLHEPNLRQYELPNYLKVTFHLITEKQLQSLIGN